MARKLETRKLETRKLENGTRLDTFHPHMVASDAPVRKASRCTALGPVLSRLGEGKGTLLMTMTRKDFIALAQLVQDYAATTDGSTRALAFFLADFCAERNPRFNRTKFLKACGLQDPF